MKYAMGLFSMLIFIMTVPVSAALTVNDDLKREIIGMDIEFLEDRDNSLTIEKVSTISNWEKLSAESVNFGFTSSPYWFRFAVNNDTKTKIEFLFEISYPLLDSVRFYRPDGPAGFSMIETGDMIPFSHRDVDDVNFIFLLRQEPVETVYYFRIETTSSLNFTPSIMSLKAYLHKKNSDQPLQWIYYGIMIVMLLYNLFIFLFSRDKSYIYYVLFIASWILFQMSLYGYAFQFLWLDSVQWCSKTVPLFISLSIGTFSLFAVSYIGTKKNFPVIHRLIVGVFIIPPIVLSLLSLFIPLVPYSLAIKLSTILAGLLATLMYVCVIIMSIKKSRQATFTVVAFTCLVIGILFFVLKTFGLIPTNFFTHWSINIGSSFVVVLLSLGLADKINVMGKEQLKAERATIKANNETLEAQKKLLTHLQEMDQLKDKVNQDLGRMVNERTVELRSTVEKLEETNKALVKMRDVLWGEMIIAKKIQTILLPLNPTIYGYDISVIMNPADEVGGDYYDIINAGMTDWIIIGDVSGHGVPAGLIMMMVQTAINVTVDQNKETLTPSELLSIINRTITNNIKMLGEDKYMTITALAAHRDGSFVFSGLHQDIMLYRVVTGEVECITTNGMWIGIQDDIKGILHNDSVTLEIGDVMVLYTDGVTEAWRKDSVQDMRQTAMDMFGYKRLMAVIKENGHKSAEDIKNSIINSLEKEFTSKDDVTIVAIKRLA